MPKYVPGCRPRLPSKGPSALALALGSRLTHARWRPEGFSRRVSLAPAPTEHHLPSLGPKAILYQSLVPAVCIRTTAPLLSRMAVHCGTIDVMPTDPKQQRSQIEPRGDRFETTHWSIVLAAGQRSSPDVDRALESLCRTYWYPLYAYVRRRVPNVHEAQDLTQEFFARFLEKDYVAEADPERGRFRAFLLTTFKHFLSKEWDKAKARKRGGGRPLVSLDFLSGESRFSVEPSENLTAEQVYSRQWAVTLLDRVMDRLRDGFVRAGKAPQFDQLKGFLIGEQAGVTYAAVADALGVTEGAVKMTVHRMRKRYRRLLRSEIGQTVASPGDVDDEIRSLFAVLSG